MLTEDFIAHFRGLLASELERMTHELRLEFNKLTSEYARRGVLQSGGAMNGIVTAAGATLPARMSLAVIQFDRCRHAYKVKLDEPTRQHAEDLLLEILASEANNLRAQAVESAPFRGMVDRHEFALKEISRVENLEGQKLRHELLLKQKAEESSSTESPAVVNNMTFNAAVSSVMTGTHAVGYTIQNIGPSDAAALKDRMDRLIETLKSAGADDEFVQIAGDVRQELNTAKPNVRKIRSLLAGLGDGIKLLPGVKAGYDILKPIAASFGILLP